MKIEAPCQYKPKAPAEQQTKKKEDFHMKHENDDKNKVTQQI